MSLRQKYTDKEWQDFEKKIKEDRENGKPDEILLYLSVWNKDVIELRKIRTALSPFYNDHSLSILDKWINWKTNNND
ncbi:MAG TPA: hypothetical protein PKD00_00100 [Burkholderiales bacterium]|nr:hypothetical protein [Burkholderiales bacterium]